MEPTAAQMALHALVAITTHNDHVNLRELNASDTGWKENGGVGVEGVLSGHFEVFFLKGKYCLKTAVQYGP